MKLVENADRLLEHAHAIYENYSEIMEPTHRTTANDRMALAMDFRHGIEDKSWLVQVQQARLYANQAKEALEIVKNFVDDAISIRKDVHQDVGRISAKQGRY